MEKRNNSVLRTSFVPGSTKSWIRTKHANIEENQKKPNKQILWDEVFLQGWVDVRFRVPTYVLIEGGNVYRSTDKPSINSLRVEQFRINMRIRQKPCRQEPVGGNVYRSTDKPSINSPRVEKSRINMRSRQKPRKSRGVKSLSPSAYYPQPYFETLLPLKEYFWGPDDEAGGKAHGDRSGPAYHRFPTTSQMCTLLSLIHI